MSVPRLNIQTAAFRFLTASLLGLMLYACGDENPKTNTGLAMIDIDFNNRIENTGMAGVDIEAPEADFDRGIKDSCLNLTGTSNKREPVIISCNEDINLTEYREFTVELWVKKTANDDERYVMAASKKRLNDKITGWEMATSCNGSWTWSLSDGSTSWNYSPTDLQQNLNDNKWHQLAFSVSSKKNEARIYFDGRNRAVYSLANLQKSCLGNNYYIGSDPLSIDLQMEAFNGLIDNFKLWARALDDNDIAHSYFTKTGKNIPDAPQPEDKVSVMTWNIWHGGRHFGKRVGVDRIIDIIKKAKPDIVILQDTEHSGEKIADGLGYYLFSRSKGLSVISKYPYGDSYDIYKPETFGCVSVKTGDDKEVFICPVMLESKPNIGAYVMTGKAIPDTIIEREMETRGLQMRFILGELSSFTLNRNSTLILGGDFNSGSHLDWTEKNKENHNGIAVELPVSKMLEQENFKDSYRIVNPDETESPGITWSPVFRNTLQDRIDFIYVKGNALTPVSSHVINSYDYDFPSSHAALITVFSLK